MNIFSLNHKICESDLYWLQANLIKKVFYSLERKKLENKCLIFGILKNPTMSAQNV